ncbi:hypothetical protein ACGFYU_35665 [Streptomyces sp. NPDC048337]|uniref:hypothetical protein n=1 Tax=Streptomyces sp. NPDC048337 TaxID=3365535 RepID=UPI003710E485
MTMHTLKQRMCALGAVLGLAIGLPFATGATPAYAEARLSVTKSHVGDFVRGGQGVYHFTIRNTGDTDPIGTVHLTDRFPQGLTLGTVNNLVSVNGAAFDCPGFFDGTRIVCNGTFPANSYLEFDFTMNVAPDAPCGVSTNTVTLSSPEDSILTSASDATRITGDTCPNGNGNGGGSSILPVNLSGVLTFFNNVSTNNNLLSPKATNATNQNLGVNAS